eukprot:GHUV01055982.1.p1 GENE.GHUV01055982.1~~GHUV01055982.1.p1  ORF type:complete len:140 (-),score=28.08 GHUV01055982.1:186-605(-)
MQYQAQCKKLPKALRDWQAYVDCRDTIDNFLEMLPLFQALAHKAMRDRHWKQLMQVTGEHLQPLLAGQLSQVNNSGLGVYACHATTAELQIQYYAGTSKHVYCFLLSSQARSCSWRMMFSSSSICLIATSCTTVTRSKS